MHTMDISTSVSLTGDEETQLIAVLGGDPQKLQPQLEAFGRAALREYVNMLLGNSTLRSPDNREERLLLIILETFNGAVPKEAEVAQWFNLTDASAAALIRKVLSRYHVRLEKTIRDASIQAVKDCGEEKNGIRSVSIPNAAIVQHLNRILGTRNGLLRKIYRDTERGSIYSVPIDSYEELKKEFNL